MATGIVSIGCHLSGLTHIAIVLFALNIIQYAICALGYVWRAVFDSRRFWQELTHHQKGPGFLTAVVGSAVIGNQFYLLAGLPFWANVFWIISLILWLTLMYLMLIGVTLAAEKPTLEQGLDGSWLLCTVSSASICILGTYVAAQYPSAQTVLLICTAAYLIGIMLYIMIISQIFYRWIFLEMEPYGFSPSYWINMGALAISTLAGARLLLSVPYSPFLQAIEPFLLGFTLFVGAFACWWIPFLLLLFIHRHWGYRNRVNYALQNWSIIFPIGMFSVAAIQFLPLIDQAALIGYLHKFVYFVLFLWTLTLIGLVRHLWKTARSTAASR